MYPSNSIADNIMKKVTDVDHYVGKYKGTILLNKATVLLKDKKMLKIVKSIRTKGTNYKVF